MLLLVEVTLSETKQGTHLLEDDLVWQGLFAIAAHWQTLPSRVDSTQEGVGHRNG